LRHETQQPSNTTSRKLPSLLRTQWYTNDTENVDTGDELIFNKDEHGPDEELRLQFEALTRFTPEEKKIAKAVLESLILKHDANRFSATG
jgi:hypothetical protein